MVTRQTIESWVLDYACKKGLHTVIQEVALRHNGDLKQFDVSEVRLACASLPHIVQESDSKSYQKALEIVEFIYSRCPAAVPFQLYTKLTFGLKKMIMMRELEKVNDDLSLLHKLHCYFPRTLEKMANKSAKENRGLNEMIDFRKFLIPLIKDDKKRQMFIKNYKTDDREKSVELLHTQIVTFVDSINMHLPITALEKMMQHGSSHYRSLLCLHHSVNMRELFQILNGNKSLSSSDLMEILNLCPTESQVT